MRPNEQLVACSLRKGFDRLTAGDDASDWACDVVDLEAQERVMRALDVGPERLDDLLGGDASALVALDELVAVLEAKLKPGRLRVVARRRAPVFGGRSMLDAIRDGELRQVLAAVRASFDWAQPDSASRVQVEQRRETPCA